MPEIASVIAGLKFIDQEPQRLFHGRGGLYPGFEFLSIDWLCPVILVTLYKTQGAGWEAALVRQLQGVMPVDVESIVIQDRSQKPALFKTLWGKPVERFAVTERGLQYSLDFSAGMHTGLFLDMAEARQWIRAHANGKRVLNLFSYTCAFSVAAIAGGADTVVNMDLSRVSLNRGRESHRLNKHEMRGVKFFAHDIFRSWGKLKRLGPFDLVIIDPPSYQPGSFVSGKDYPRVFRQLPGLLAEQAEVLACSNDPDQSPAFLQALVSEYCPALTLEQRLPNPLAFADADEQRSLKVLHFKPGGFAALPVKAITNVT